MPRPLPRVVRVPFHALRHRDSFDRHVVELIQPVLSDIPRIIHTYAFRNDEREFARSLLEKRTQLWLFRANQSAFCGDFIAVDLSCPNVKKRRIWAIELKQNRPLLERDGPVGIQLQQAAAGLAELARTSIITDDSPWKTLIGDRREVLGYFGVLPVA